MTTGRGRGRRRFYGRRPAVRVKGHARSVEVEHDPEGNFWTVTCECGAFQESGSTRQVVYDEHYWHLQRVLAHTGSTVGPTAKETGDA